ncbi:MAG: phosphate ABC transporter permease PstA [Nevskiaceae bacterium]|jgi:phosphate transport system permease protein|nr:phosphate ABC transporter permease PstA [Nevskiaceae bacterium]
MSNSVQQTQARVAASLRRRYRAERRFKLYGLLAVLLGVSFVLFLFGAIIAQGAAAFRQAQVTLDIQYNEDVLGLAGERTPEALATADYAALVREALRARFPDAQGREGGRAALRLVSNSAAHELQRRVEVDPSRIGTGERLTFLAGADVDQFLKGKIDRTLPEDQRPLSDQQIAWIDALREDGALRLAFNRGFFTNGDSREPEQAGVLGALAGSMYTLLVTLVLSFPIGVAAAAYLEEFAPRNRWTDLIEVNINNLAAVPSIVFGLLGLALFLNFFGLPRSAPLVGGLVLTLLTLPTIIITSRAAIRAVPPSIREAALGMGASNLQMVTDHVLPLAMPGILTGAIIGLARALGETAPLLMIGMVAFIVDVPRGFTDPSTVLPVQVFLWADSPERAFVERTSAAIIVLLLFLLIVNATAAVLRRRFERRW